MSTNASEGSSGASGAEDAPELLGNELTWLSEQEVQSDSSNPSFGDSDEPGELFEALFEVPAEPQRLGRYLVLSTVGRGAMGTVFEAFDPSSDRRVALKVLHPGLPDRQRQRLLREAEALGKLSHPSIVQIYDVGDADGQTFIATELVRGKTLTKWLEQDPRPTWRETIEVYAQAGDGLAAVHAEGFVHRDFKPGNAVVDAQGQVRLLDFGLVRQSDRDPGRDPKPPGPDPDTVYDAEARMSLTGTGAVLGTPAYMPLEQMRGHKADARSDQFAFCVSLYEALYGERPFDDSTMDTLVQSMTHDRVRPAPEGATVPDTVRQALLRGLMADPDRRWPTLNALLADLRRLAAPPRRWPWLAAVGGVVVVAAGLGAWAVQARSTPSADEASSLSARGVDLRRRGQLTEALAAHQQALSLRKAEGERSAAVARSLTNVGVVLTAQGQLPRALEHHRRALEIRQEVLGPSHPAVAASLTNVGAVLHRQGKLDEAHDACQRALAIVERAHGAEHPGVASLLVVLGQLGLARGDLDGARRHAERAVTLRESAGASAASLAEARFVLAQALLARPDERGRALQQAQQARDAYAALGAEGSDALGQVDVWLAEARSALGQTPAG